MMKAGVLSYQAGIRLEKANEISNAFTPRLLPPFLAFEKPRQTGRKLGRRGKKRKHEPEA